MKSHAKPPPDICGGLTRGAMVEAVTFTVAALAVAGTLAGVRPIGLASTSTVRTPPAAPTAVFQRPSERSPESAGTRQSRISVLLPDPDGPQTPVSSP